MIEQSLQLATAHHKAGRFAEAAKIYRQILADYPDEPDALHLLGFATYQSGDSAAGLELIDQAISLSPQRELYHLNRGAVLMAMDRPADAAAAYRRAIEIRPDFPEGHYNLGVALAALKQIPAAIDAYQTAVRFRPNWAIAQNNLGNVLVAAKRWSEAESAFGAAISLEPENPLPWRNLGWAFGEQKRLPEALDCLKRALAIRADDVDALVQMGSVLQEMNRADDSIAALEKAIALQPENTVALNNLGQALKGIGEIDRAIETFTRAMKSGQPWSHSNRIHARVFDASADSALTRLDLLDWNRRFAGNVPRCRSSRADRPDPARRLRIGYVSADFFAHSSDFFLEPLLKNHDHSDFEIVCYADVDRPDDQTRRLSKYPDAWNITAGTSDQDLIRKIEVDRIDVLVDLKLHTGKNRLLVFAAKPAPIQVSWLGYPGSSGVETIDFRLTDRFLEPSGDEYSLPEKPIALPDCFWCYDPLSDAPPVGELPALRNGFPTFGCLNMVSKLTAATAELWGAALRPIADYRLLVLAPTGRARELALDRLGNAGIEKKKIEFVDRSLRAQYLRMHDRIDLCLDTIPCNGHTTSFDGLWMGVPLVTRVGQTPCGRAGASILNNLGLPDLVAKTAQEFAKMVADLAGDRHRLAQLRITLRKRMENSPLMDGPRFARNMQTIYRQIWRDYCAKHST